MVHDSARTFYASAVPATAQELAPRNEIEDIDMSRNDFDVSPSRQRAIQGSSHRESTPGSQPNAHKVKHPYSHHFSCTLFLPPSELLITEGVAIPDSQGKIRRADHTHFNSRRTHLMCLVWDKLRASCFPRTMHTTPNGTKLPSHHFHSPITKRFRCFPVVFFLRRITERVTRCSSQHNHTHTADGKADSHPIDHA